MENEQNFSNDRENNKKSSNGCVNCFGCFGGCVFVIIILTVLSGFGIYYFLNTYGREISANQIDNMSNVMIDKVMTDEKLKENLRSNIKNFTNKIRNKEIDMLTISTNMRKLEKDGTPLKFALFAMYGESLASNTVITSDEQKNIQQIIYALRKNDIDITQLASFTQIIQTSQKNKYDIDGKNRDVNKLHKAIEELKKVVTENKLEDPGDKFNIEELVSNEINKLLKTLSDGKDAITGKAATDVMEQMEHKSSEVNN